MTLYIDSDANELVAEDGTVVGPIDGPPYTIPDDAIKAVWAQFPSDHASVSVQDLMWTLDAACGDVEFGPPPQ